MNRNIFYIIGVIVVIVIVLKLLGLFQELPLRQLEGSEVYSLLTRVATLSQSVSTRNQLSDANERPMAF